METKEIRFKNGNTITVGPLFATTAEKASRLLAKEKITITSGADPLHHTTQFTAEVALCAVKSWTAPDGSDVLAKTDRQTLRTMLLENQPLLDLLMSEARKLGEKAEGGFEVDSGN